METQANSNQRKLLMPEKESCINIELKISIKCRNATSSSRIKDDQCDTDGIANTPDNCIGKPSIKKQRSSDVRLIEA